MPTVAKHEFMLIVAVGCIIGTLLGALATPPPLWMLGGMFGVCAFLGMAVREQLGRIGAPTICLFVIVVCGTWLHAATFTPNERALEPLLDITPYISRALERHLLLPSSALIDGILTGNDSALPSTTKRAFNITGTRHITAVSGMNITILGNVLVALLVALGLRRTRASAATLVAIAWYVLMIGSPASAVRAGIMGSLLVIKQLLGRPGSALRLLVYAVAAMLLWNPTLLTHDIGFQLSVLATAGIILLEPVLQSRLRWMPEVLAMRSTVSTTIAAYLFTLPAIAHYFGTVSLSAVPANFLIAPVITWVFITGSLGVFIALLLPSIGYIALAPAHFASTYVIAVVSTLSRVPYAETSLAVSAYWSIPYFALTLLFIHKNSRTDKYFRVESEY